MTPKRDSFALLALFVLLTVSPIISYRMYNNYKLVRMEVDLNRMTWLEKLVFRHRKHLDLWSEPSKFNAHAEILVSPRFYGRFLKILERNDVTNVRLLSDNIQKQFDRDMREMEQDRESRKRRSIKDKGSPYDEYDTFDLHKYHDYPQILDYMNNLARNYSDLVGIINITKTFENCDLIGLKIGKRQPWKPAIFLDAGIHAREWIAPAVAIYVADKLVRQYGHDEQITRMVDKFDWFILPVANPDGYQYSITTDRLWRKTRSRNDSISAWCVGVDGNRNWEYRWADASKSPCADIYGGSRPFSEPETRGVRDFIQWQIPDLKLYVSLHSFGQLWLAPWGYANIKPKNHQDQRAAAEQGIKAIWNSTGAIYQYGTIADLMYPAFGTSIDYMQHKGVPYIYGVELRPTDDDSSSYGFSIDSSFIRPAGEEMLTAMLAVSEYIIKAKRL